MQKLIVATKNKGKVKEIKEILGALPFDIVSMEEVGIHIDVEETGSTFEENALIKARAISEIAGEIALADDSGLEVDYLDGAPGIYSARFSGEGASDQDRNNKLLSLMAGVPVEKRTARFVCAIAAVFPDKQFFVVRETWDGYINDKPKGDNGFGYDPLLYLPEFGKTVAELDTVQKNAVSHRGKALVKMMEELKKTIL